MPVDVVRVLGHGSTVNRRERRRSARKRLANEAWPDVPSTLAEIGIPLGMDPGSIPNDAQVRAGARAAVAKMLGGHAVGISELTALVRYVFVASKKREVWDHAWDCFEALIEWREMPTDHCPEGSLRDRLVGFTGWFVRTFPLAPPNDLNGWSEHKLCFSAGGGLPEVDKAILHKMEGMIDWGPATDVDEEAPLEFPEDSNIGDLNFWRRYIERSARAHQFDTVEQWFEEHLLPAARMLSARLAAGQGLALEDIRLITTLTIMYTSSASRQNDYWRLLAADLARVNELYSLEPTSEARTFLLGQTWAVLKMLEAWRLIEGIGEWGRQQAIVDGEPTVNANPHAWNAAQPGRRRPN